MLAKNLLSIHAVNEGLCLGALFIVKMEKKEVTQDKRSRKDKDVGEVEYPSANLANTDAYKIDNTTIIEDPVEKVTNSTSSNKDERQSIFPAHAFP